MYGPKWPFLLVYGPGVVVVQYWDRLYFGNSSPYKGDSARFSLSPKS